MKKLKKFYCQSLYFGRRLQSKLIRRFNLKPRWLKKAEMEALNDLNSFDSEFGLKETQEAEGVLNIRIHGKSFLFSTQSELSFSDIEDLYYFHRWNWLLIEGFSSPNLFKTNVLPFLEYWIVQWGSDTKEPEAWDAYTAGERVINFLICWLAFFPEQNPPIWFKSFAEVSAKYIVQNLEYYGMHTCNHIVNNARACFVLGCYLDKPSLLALADKILARYLSVFITKNGFLREASAHYQFLFTRWLLDIYGFAVLFKNTETDLIKKIFNYLPKLLFMCEFLSVGEKDNLKIPLIGDVSPDFTWQFLMPLISNLISKKDKNKTPFWFHPVMLYPPFSNQSIQCFEEEGWAKLIFGEIVVFIRFGLQAVLNIPNHAHEDFLGYSLYLSGEPVVVDIGRSIYAEGQEARDAYQAGGHNTICVNGFSPIDKAASRWRHNSVYQPEKLKVSYQDAGDYLEFCIEHACFERLNNIGVHTRTFKLFKDHLEILDRFILDKSCQIEAYCHFSPEFKLKKIENNKVEGLNQVGVRKVVYKVDSPCDLLVSDYQFSDNYGLSEAADQVVVKATLFKNQPVVLQTLSW